MNGPWFRIICVCPPSPVASRVLAASSTRLPLLHRYARTLKAMTMDVIGATRGLHSGIPFAGDALLVPKLVRLERTGPGRLDIRPGEPTARATSAGPARRNILVYSFDNTIQLVAPPPDLLEKFTDLADGSDD